MPLEINVVDTFTDTLFKGNPAAVIIMDDWLDEAVMQAIAAENNLSETAFLVADAAEVYHIRWFSPLMEIDFCGHGTLGSAFVLFTKNPDVSTLTFFAKAVGGFTVVQNDDGKIQMDFPNTEPKKVDDIPQALLAGLSVTPTEVYVNEKAYFVIYPTESDVLTLKRDNEQLKQLAPLKVVVSCQAQSADYAQYDFISRYFLFADGGEDPVTGSVHTALAPLWAKRLNKNKMLAYQASSRGGVLHCELVGDRVLISGHAVPYLTGVISV